MTTSVNDFSPFLGQPIRSIQTVLREIGNQHEEMPKVIPDGIYGSETEASVRWFQEFTGLPVTGVVDKTTWDALFDEYISLLIQREPPRCIQVLPDDFITIYPGETRAELTIIQSLLKSIADELDTVENLAITGIHDEQSVNSVKSLQKILGKEEQGAIDKDLWNALSDVYEAHISKPRFQR